MYAIKRPRVTSAQDLSMFAVTLIVDARRVETFADALIEGGALSVDVTDAAAGTEHERPLFAEPGSAPRINWPVNRVTALFAQEAEIARIVPQALRAAALPPTTSYGIDAVPDADWVRITQSQWAPQKIAPQLWVVPTWHEVVDPDAINIRLDPGLAFGTGTHPTTRLCLRWLYTHLQRGASVIDYGCGSGILAISAMKLGASRAAGVDIDEQSLLAARYNAMQNQTEVAFFAAAEELDAPADVVVANILANPLTVLAPLLSHLTRAGGQVVLSGILAPQADEVRVAYERWFDMHDTAYDENWVLLVGTRKKDKG
jgi:ribosomal protein L11 methyltransferase